MKPGWLKRPFFPGAQALPFRALRCALSSSPMTRRATWRSPQVSSRALSAGSSTGQVAPARLHACAGSSSSSHFSSTGTRLAVYLQPCTSKRHALPGQPVCVAIPEPWASNRRALQAPLEHSAACAAMLPPMWVAGMKDMSVLKTTQSGYTGFLRDQYTLLPEVTDRIMATTITCTWRYTSQPSCYDAAYAAAKGAIMDAYYGPPKSGVYSPSVQYTLHQMASTLMDRVPQAESVFLNLPNIHFLPCAPVGSTFKNDVYVATSEPHGNIEATVTRKNARPHCKL